MKEIKLRAWDRIAKKMYYSAQEQFDDMLGFRFEHFEDEEPIYMLSTGLEDKNGKEIYEGDVVKYDGLYFESGLYEIKFINGSFIGVYENMS